MTIDFNEVSRVVTKRVKAKYGNHVDSEDAVQEALIQAWKDMETGEYEYAHLVNRAVTWARKYLFPGTNAQKATGAARTSAQGYVRNPAAREKIRMWREQYIELHGKVPTQKEIAQGVGMSQGMVSYHLKKMTDTNVKAIKTADGKRVDYSAYTTQTLTPVWSEVDQDYNRIIGAPSFEDDLLTELDFTAMISKYEPDVREVVVLHFVYDWTFMDIGKHLWPEVTDVAGRTRAQRVIEKVKASIKAEMLGEPEAAPVVEVQTKKCYKKKHFLTPENSITVKDGRVRCKKCQEQKYEKLRNKRNTSIRKCKNGHYLSPENTIKRGDGGRRCKRCAADWMANKRKQQG